MIRESSTSSGHCRRPADPVRSQARFAWLACLLVILAWPSRSAAHDFTITEASMTVAEDGTLTLDFTCDLDALALGAAPDADEETLIAALEAMDDAELETHLTRLERLLARRVKVRVDNQILSLDITFPDRGVPPPADQLPTYLGTTARMIGRPAEELQAFTFMASRAFPPVHLSVHYAEVDATRFEILEQGGTSAAYSFEPSAEELAAATSSSTVLVRYLKLGFTHIVPKGLDHVLFVLGLFFFGLGIRPLLLQVTAFTLAHTVTLALATLGVFSLPGSVVEPLIALSIAWVAIENIVSKRSGQRDAAGQLSASGAVLLGNEHRLRWRMVLVFGFGLLHGLGFAGVLGELGLPRDALLTALLAFNVGVELGQLAVLAGAFALIGWARKRPWYRTGIAIPSSLLIAATGLYWFVERLFFS